MLPYEHGGDIYSQPVQLDFSVNINPFGMPEAVKQAIVDHVASYATYPDPFCRQLRAGLASALAVPAEHILCGNGAADLIYRLCLALRPGQVLIPVPTFTDYARAARLAGARVIEHPLDQEDGFLLDEGVLAAIKPGLAMVFLCNPNNPTGRLISPRLLARILRRCADLGILLLVDECFLPFTDGQSLIPQSGTVPQLLVLRAFTKTYAMAGLRLGYLVTSNLPVLRELAGFGQSWSVSAVAQQAGLAALGCPDELARVRAYLQQARPRLARALAELGLWVFASKANYLLFKSRQPLAAALLEQGILIRNCRDFAGLDEDYYRIAVRLPEENKRLLLALRGLLAL